ncbi:MAG: hypothetical protein A2W98_14635 [Bacteroidetes bacterium GWF2_33_38]|nr:MAG: hypothetical protein A2W98_14635 [Bacteroidetes bacterium GWF2_33_38]OFY76488.1 MAG: hypothetical protein A2265_08775 [Bacteroidetes bacterium RIFOXYA12_FULL_33_9]OFY89733.1 MAG: hypothetical protein A2236_09670 [Bacteroidetes bacterium RIFOXYA2_FULL_33_7]HBX52624.1 hypothetical protein [Bacteroidales bacterium]
MTKKIILFSVSSIIVISLILLGYYYFAKDKQTVNSQALNAIPLDAVLIFQSNNALNFFDALASENQIWHELQTIETVKNLNNNILYLDSVGKKYDNINSFLGKSPLVISTHIVGKATFDFLFLISINDAEYAEVSKTIKEIVGSNGIFTERTYNKEKIIDVKITKGNGFSYSHSNGVFMFSYTSILVEDGLRQINLEDNFLTDRNFVKVSNTAGKNVDANIYINFKTFPKFASIFLSQNYKSYINSFTNFANWSELDLTMKNDVFLLNGFTYSNDSTNNFLNIFNSETPQSSNFESILPSNTSLFCAIGFDNFAAYNKNFKKYLEKEGKLSSQKEQLNKLNDKFHINLEKVFSEFIENQAVLAYTDINSLDPDQNIFALIQTKSKKLAEERMVEAIKDHASQSNREFASYINVCEIDQETKFPIYESPTQYISANLFGSMFSKVNGKYFTFIENYIVFSNSVAAISNFIHANILQKTMQNDLAYAKFTEYLSSKSNFYFYMSTSRSLPLISHYIDKDLAKNIEKYTNTFQKFQAIAYQFSASKNMIYNNFVIKFNPVYKDPPRTAWECHLDTNILFKPKLLINHETNEKEIFIQDINNTIYLINETGGKLWQKKLDEKIISEIYQIDYFKNGKLQILFNTKNRIYLIDRNGNHVERYPVNLSSPATNGIAVFDYDDSRDYRFVIATADKKVTLYSTEGNVVTGWGFNKTESFVKNEVQHFRVEDKDYIVFSDSLNTYLLDRKGNTRIKPKSTFPRSKNNLFTIENATKLNEARLVVTDTSGNIIKIKMDGTVEKFKIETYSSKHYFDFQDVDADGKSDYIFIDDKKLEVFNSKKESLFTYEFDEQITLKPAYYNFGTKDRKIGVSSEIESKIFLFNQDGSLYEGFPLRGKTLFSIGSLNNSKSKFNLIVGSDNNFLYNYEVN